MLTAYALFTREQADYYLQSERPLDEVSEQLFQNSFHWGQALRKLIGVKTWDEAMATLQVIYQVIGIDFHCDETGHVCVQRCFFHQYYTKEVCQLIAALDSGVAAGLAGGSNLIFTQRITEGYQCCKGVLSR